jgi:hypothetical protein
LFQPFFSGVLIATASKLGSEVDQFVSVPGVCVEWARGLTGALRKNMLHDQFTLRTNHNQAFFMMLNNDFRQKSIPSPETRKKRSSMIKESKLTAEIKT